MTTLLRVSLIDKHFQGYQALADIDCNVEAGAIHALIGPNGAGKSTLFNIISGVMRPTKGQLFFEADEYTGRRPDQIVFMGIARNFQQVRLFPGLSVLENVMIGAHAAVSRHWRDMLPFGQVGGRPDARMRGRALDEIAFVGLADKASLPPESLTLVDQRRLEIARALASGPRLLLLDEPAAGMNPSEVNDLGAIIRRIRDRGVTVLLVEHHMRLVMTVAEQITVLAAGRIIAEGSPAQIQNDEAVLSAYLGTQP